jgi:hypothetical protein
MQLLRRMGDAPAALALSVLEVRGHVQVDGHQGIPTCPAQGKRRGRRQARGGGGGCTPFGAIGVSGYAGSFPTDSAAAPCNGGEGAARAPLCPQSRPPLAKAVWEAPRARCFPHQHASRGLVPGANAPQAIDADKHAALRAEYENDAGAVLCPPSAGGSPPPESAAPCGGAASGAGAAPELNAADDAAAGAGAARGVALAPLFAAKTKKKRSKLLSRRASDSAAEPAASAKVTRRAPRAAAWRRLARVCACLPQLLMWSRS